ncbi:MAG: hypothetical protein MI753_05660 [Hyphomicrobiales bacterium]|nr:hypothetical protein [Hyphomicrobiales bacterium]
MFKEIGFNETPSNTTLYGGDVSGMMSARVFIALPKDFPRHLLLQNASDARGKPDRDDRNSAVALQFAPI